jgi:putative radical SAM enzyme (TIGR03279 family)
MLLGSSINSVSIVPVGLTKHRDSLVPLAGFDSELAKKTIQQVHRLAKRSFRRNGKRVFYCSDELYMLAGSRLPSHSFYEDYPQLENGVGMMRVLITEFLSRLRQSNPSEFSDVQPFSIVTGILAAKHLKYLLNMLEKCYDSILGTIYPISNDFFGDSITVSGLVTGNDILEQVRDKPIGSKLLIPQNMLRSGENMFLDDVTVDELSDKLGVPIRVVKQDGADLFDAIFESKS